MKHTQNSYDIDELGQELRDHVEARSKANMPAPVQVQIIDGSMQFTSGWVWGQINDRIVRVIVFGPSSVLGATAANPYTVWALPPNDDSPTSPYIALGVAAVGEATGGFPIGRVPPIVTPIITDPDGNPFSGSGTVISVAMTVPAFLSVSGSPITTSGTLAVTLATETANTVFAGPTGGGAATPTFRSLVSADIPDLSGTYIPKSLVDAKGDLIVGTADNTVTRVAAGGLGSVLTADSGQAAGVKWATAGFVVGSDITSWIGMYL